MEIQNKTYKHLDALGAKFSASAFVTDGLIIRKILTVKYNGNHFVFIYPSENPDNHITYHRDGNVFERIYAKGRILRKMTYSSLDNYTGDATIVGAFLNIDKPDTWGRVSRKITGEVVTIDLRPCFGKTNVVSIEAPILVPHNLNIIENYYRKFKVIACTVFKQTNPWFAIVGYFQT